MFSRSYKQDATSVPSRLSEKLCIFGVVLTPCQGKLFALCDRCAVLNNLRDWWVERRTGTGFLSWSPVKISHCAGVARFYGGLHDLMERLSGTNVQEVERARSISKEARCRCV